HDADDHALLAAALLEALEAALGVEIPAARGRRRDEHVPVGEPRRRGRRALEHRADDVPADLEQVGRGAHVAPDCPAPTDRTEPEQSLPLVDKSEGLLWLRTRAAARARWSRSARTLR